MTDNLIKTSRPSDLYTYKPAIDLLYRKFLQKRE